MCTGPNAINKPGSVQQQQILETEIPSLVKMLQDIHDLKELKDRLTLKLSTK